MVLTIVAVAAEELVEAGKVGPTAEVGAFRYQDLLDQREAVDDDARGGPQVDAEDVPVDPAQGGEGLEGRLVTGKEVHAADEGPGPWPRDRHRGLLRPLEPPHQQHHTQTEEREHVCSEFT